MNALTPIVTVRAVDLAEPGELARIDAFVHDHPAAEFFHRPQWSRAVEQGCRQRSHYLVAENDAGALVGCLPLSEIRSILFGNALVSAGFATGGGILAATETAAAALADQAWALAETLGCSSAELRGGPVPSGWEAGEGSYAAFSRSLGSDPEALLGSIPRRQRAEVRRALTFDLETSTGRDQRHLAAFHRVYSESVRNLGTPVYPTALFEAMAEEFGDAVDIIVVWKDGRPLSAFYSFRFRETAHAYWGGGIGDARTFRANELVYYAFMRNASERGCTIADFGRSKLGTGAYDRKRNWGFEERPLAYAVRNADGAAPREINPLNPRYRAKIELWKKLPLPVANLVGPFIARGLG
jgi:FemAB-related protein (PEP-CTERM system-associated)